jgi:hypothetical protein
MCECAQYLAHLDAISNFRSKTVASLLKDHAAKRSPEAFVQTTLNFPSCHLVTVAVKVALALLQDFWGTFSL